MCIPAHFEETRLDVMYQLIHAHPFAALVVPTEDGLVANHLPFYHQQAKVSLGCCVDTWRGQIQFGRILNLNKRHWLFLVARNNILRLRGTPQKKTQAK